MLHGEDSDVNLLKNKEYIKMIPWYFDRNKALMTAVLCLAFIFSATAAFASLTFSSDTITTDSSLLLLGGNVGIGTTSPAALLTINDTATGAGNDLIRFLGNGNNAVGTILGGIDFFNGDSSGSGPNISASIKAVSNNSNGAGGVLVFYTHPQGSVEGEAAIEAMRIAGDNGTVGIGTSSPNVAYKLDVSGDINTSANLRFGGILTFSATAPTVSAGFGTAKTVEAGSTTASWTITITTASAQTTGTLSLPTTAHRWTCWATNQTTNSKTIFQSASADNSASFTSTSAWADGDIIIGGCSAH